MNILILVPTGLLYFLKKNEIVYFDSFRVEHVLREIGKFIEEFPGHKNIKANIVRVQSNNSIIC